MKQKLTDSKGEADQSTESKILILLLQRTAYNKYRQTMVDVD